MSAENTPNTPTEDSLPTSETTDVKDNAIDPVTESAAEQNTDLAESDAHDAAYPRLIKTFMKRRTHLNKNAEQALTDPIYAKYIVNTMDDRGQGVIDDITDLRALFADTEQTPNGPDAPLTFEIGFGMGGSLIEMAKADPSRNFVGIEVHEPGIGKCAFMANEEGLTNLKIINGDAIGLMQQLPENHIDRIQLYFPDPWQKKRHYKRRFVSPKRMEIVTRVLNQGGWFHTATDWEHYAFWMLEVLDNFEGLTNTAGKGNFTPRPDFRPMTKFEKRGIDRGHGVWDLIYTKD